MGWRHRASCAGSLTSTHFDVRRFEDLRSRGAGYLVFPNTAFWWLDHYEGFRKHLESVYATVLHDQNCIIFALQTQSGLS